jgi:hypothetical protein
MPITTIKNYRLVDCNVSSDLESFCHKDTKIQRNAKEGKTTELQRAESNTENVLFAILSALASWRQKKDEAKTTVQLCDATEA